MKVALLQADICLGKYNKNCSKIQGLFAKAMADKPDVVVLPELWDVGFFPKNLKAYDSKNAANAKKMLSQLAAQYKVNIIGGSIAEFENELLYNKNYVFNRNGDVVSAYKKMHLFSPSEENKMFRPGNKLGIFTIEEIRAAVVICYDIRFCELIRLLALEKIAVLFVVAAWPKERLNHWQTLLEARAIENQIFIVAVNSVGENNQIKFGGSSMVINPWGEVIAIAGQTEGSTVATIDLESVSVIQHKMNVFNDRRADLYSLKF